MSQFIHQLIRFICLVGTSDFPLFLVSTVDNGTLIYATAPIISASRQLDTMSCLFRQNDSGHYSSRWGYLLLMNRSLKTHHSFLNSFRFRMLQKTTQHSDQPILILSAHRFIWSSAKYIYSYDLVDSTFRSSKLRACCPPYAVNAQFAKTSLSRQQCLCVAIKIFGPRCTS